MSLATLRGDWHGLGSVGLGVFLVMATPSTFAEGPGAARARQSQEPPAERDRLIGQVEALRQAGKLDEAVNAAERILELERRTGGEMPARLADALSRLAGLHELQGRWDKAVGFRREALVLRERADGKDHWQTADARLALAFAEKVAGLGAAERAKVEGALRKEQDAGRLEAQGKYAAAKASFEEALAIRHKALPPDRAGIAQSLHNLGMLHFDLREFAAAKASFEEALAIRREALPPDHPDMAYSLNNLGVLQWRLGDFAAAKACHEEALAMLRKSLPADHPDIARSLSNLGIAQSALRVYAAAHANYEEALAVLRKSLPPGHPDIAQNLNNLGTVQFILREYAAATASHAEALAIRRKSMPPDHPYIASSLFNLAQVGVAAGIDVGDVIPRLAEAADLLQADQLRLAILQAEPEQLATAAKARLCLHSLIDATITTRGDPGPAYDRVVRGKGSVTAQQRWAREARDSADADTARLLDRLRQVTEQIVGLSVGERLAGQGRDPSALRDLSEERARLEQQLAERSAVYRSIQKRARLGTGDVRSALPEGTALIDLVEYRHKEALAAGQQEPVEERRLAGFMVRPDLRAVAVVPLGPSKDLFELVDRWRASYGAGKAPAAGAGDPGAALRQRLWEPLAKHLEGIKAVLVSPDGPLNGLPWAALPGSKKCTFLVDEDAFAVVPAPQLLPELVRNEPSQAKELPSLLLAGGIDFGAGTHRAPGAPAGKLPPLPLYGPLPGTESEVNDLEARFRRAFPRAAAPRALSAGRATKQAVLAAVPTHRFVHLATHGFFAGEAEESAVAVAQRGERLRGGLRLLPEAAGRHPGLLSGLVFAGVNQADRHPEETILTALEAAELDLGNVELVVLSACDTGRGQVAGGEGVLGLQRALQLAGARSLVASLWKVPDLATRVLMAEFYKNLWEKKLPKLEALRQARLTLLREYKPQGGPARTGLVTKGPVRVEDLPEKKPADDAVGRPAPSADELLPPFHWAAFVLSGDWR